MLDDTNRLDKLTFSAFHGLPFSQANILIKRPSTRLTRGPRDRDVDNVQEDESYGGKWHVSSTYVKSQHLLSEDNYGIGAISVGVMSVDSIRISRGQKNGCVVLMTNAHAKAILFREDDNDVTLREIDR